MLIRNSVLKVCHLFCHSLIENEQPFYSHYWFLEIKIRGVEDAQIHIVFTDSSLLLLHPSYSKNIVQEIPWADQPLVYVQKFRFYYQPYNASYHTNLEQWQMGIASPVEYDVPKCSAGIMGCAQGRIV